MPAVVEAPIALLNRKYTIEIRGIQIKDSLRCTFKVKRSLKPKPGTCELSIYNLTKANREAIEMVPDNDTFDVTLKKVTFTAQRIVNLVRIEAGYEQGTQQIYYGETRSANTEWNGTDSITKVASGDSEKQMQLARISVPIGAATPIDEAMRQIVALTGIGEGNLALALADMTLSDAARMFVNGSMLYGNAFHQLDAICKAAQLEWSVQGGVFQFLKRGQALAQNAVLLTSQVTNSGIIGSPVVDKKGILKIKTLMIPTLYPGRLVVLDTRDAKGTWRVEQCEYTGDTWGKEWYVESWLSKVATV
jgi:hypothetical protein